MTLPCYCSAAEKNRSACAELLFLALGFQPNGCIPDLSWNSPATVLLLQILVFPALNCCLALGFQPTGLMPDFELEVPCYCSSAAAKYRFACTELLSGPALPTERVYA